MTKPARAKPRKPPKARVEGWDEGLMVRFAFFLAAIVAVAAIYQTMTWAHVWAHG